MKNKFIIAEPEIGERLDKILTQKFPDTTRSQWQKVIQAGLVLLNQKTVTVHHFVKLGEEVEIIAKSVSQPAKQPLDKTAAKKRLSRPLTPKIIFEDKNYLVINKPSGLLVHPTDKQETDTLVDWLKKERPEIEKNLKKDPTPGYEPGRPGLVHRLDAEVSGLMVIAKNSQALADLKRQFHEHLIKKEYTALVYGDVIEPEGKIELSIGRATSGQKMAARHQALTGDRAALTLYETLQHFLNYALLKVTIKTGRTHQIRAHLQAIGHPIVGDQVYRPKKDSFHTGKKIVKIKSDLTRPFLHSTTLGFTDLDGRWQEFTAKMPKELTEYLAKIKN